MFNDLAVWSDKPRWAGSGFTRLVVELADLPGHPARSIARKHKAVPEEQLAAVFARAGLVSPRDRAREIWPLILVHGNRRYAAAAAAKRLIAASPGKTRREPG